MTARVASHTVSGGRCVSVLSQPFAGCLDFGVGEQRVEVVRTAGERLVLPSDAGQTDSPPPPDALALLVDALAREGVDRSRLHAAAGAVPAGLFLK